MDNDSGRINALDGRKARIARMKKVIIITILILILIPIILCIFLFVKVQSLEKQMYELYETKKNEAILMEAHAAREEELLQLQEITNQTAAMEEDNSVKSTLDDSKENQNHLKAYLTFDDGPSPLSNEILDILKYYQVKATFFVVGTEREDMQDVYRRIVNEGHALGMHSFSHQYTQMYASKENFTQDFNKLRNLLYENTGVMSNIYRFPGGSSNSTSKTSMNELISYLSENNITYYDWNVSAGDALSENVSEEDLISNVLDKMDSYREAIILLHDSPNKQTTVNALPQIIEQLQEMGAEIAVIDQNTALIQQIKIEDIKE